MAGGRHLAALHRSDLERAVSDTYLLASESEGLELIRALVGEMRVERGEVRVERYHYRDTFDWRAFNAGGELRIVDGSPPLRLEFHRPGGRVTAAVGSDPDFASDLPEGVLKNDLGALIAPRRLLPVLSVAKQRQEFRILNDDDKTVVRVALEQREFRLPGDGDAEARCHVLVLEPVRGYERAAARVEETLSRHLTRSAESELVLGLMMLGRRAGGEGSGFSVELDTEGTVVDAARRILEVLFDAVRRNEAGARDNLDPEFLHDFRVAVRRTRSALAQIKGAFDADEVRPYRREFSWLGDITSAARDLDVYSLHMPRYRSLVAVEMAPHLDLLEGYLEELREQAYTALRGAIGGPRYHELIHAWATFLRTGPETPGPAASLAVAEHVARLLRRAHRRVLRHGSGIGPETPAAALHRLRLECKKLRYLIEFFAGLYAREDVEATVRSLKQLQDSLGTFNDLDLEQRALGVFAEEIYHRGAPPDALLAMGALVERLGERKSAARYGFQARFEQFAGKANRRRFKHMWRGT